MQEQIAAGRSVQLASIIRAQYSSGKISFPVDGGLYARFKHIQGVPAQGTGGYSLSKLQMIDLMVERLVRLRGEGMETPTPASDAEADALVNSLAAQIHGALGLAETPQGSFAAGIVESGLLFNLVA
ncbi:MAG: hypothetical protein ACOC1I_06400 [Spirochaetota bacterium]